MAPAACELKGKVPEEAKTPMTFLHLPIEAQREIVGHCAQAELICLSLVSKHFRGLAAAQLYRNFFIVFPDEDDPTYDSPIDGLAGGLDTFVTSDYNYSQHLRAIYLDTLSGGETGEKAYKPYLYTSSCGKFMNTLFLLTLKKATCLESFKWNIRVELSRPVYKALHRIPTLNKVHIRMQAGLSLYEPPPALPLAPVTPLVSGPALTWTEQPVSLPPPPPPNLFPPPGPFPTGPPPFTATVVVPHYVTPPPPQPKAPPKPKLPRRVSMTNEPPTLSGFKNLKSLSILDMDSLDMITELKACIRNSEGTLSHLKLSFSDSLASKSRKPPDNDPEDSDVDEEFQVVALPPTSGDSGGPAKAFRAQEEKRTQETMLGRIFGVDHFVAKNLTGRPKKEKPKVEDMEKLSPEDAWVSSLKLVSRKLLAIVKESDPSVAPGLAEQEVLDIIVSAAKKYTKSDSVQKGQGGVGSPSTSLADGDATPTQLGSSSSSTPTVELNGITSGGGASGDNSMTMANGFARSPGSKDFDTGGNDLKDIDIAYTGDTESLGCSSDSGSEDTAITNDAPPSEHDTKMKMSTAIFGDNRASSSSSSSSRKPTPVTSSVPPNEPTNLAGATIEAHRSKGSPLRAKLHTYRERVKQLDKEIQKLQDNPDPDTIAIHLKTSQLVDVKREIRIIEQDIKTMQADILEAQKQAVTDNEEARSRSISDYVKSTRGLGLKSLAIHLIPVRPSVLSRAVDLHVLEELTLLNVGNQNPIWMLLQKENEAHPLALKKIFTDNVTQSFLKCVSELKEVTELFMLERSAKHKPESFAPRSAVAMDQIRKFVLKRHLPTLKYLMIKNDYQTVWDIDEKAMLLICHQGKNLEELTVSMGIRSVHMLCQHMSNLANLRALNVAHFRNDDTCVWVMRETQKFIIDTLAHHSHLKLEWISVASDRVVQVIRNEGASDGSDKKKKKDKKGKGKATSTFAASIGFTSDDTLPMIPSIEGWDSDDSSDDDMEDELKVTMHENLHFYDVWGVRSFEKEILLGKL